MPKKRSAAYYNLTIREFLETLRLPWVTHTFQLQNELGLAENRYNSHFVKFLHNLKQEALQLAASSNSQLHQRLLAFPNDQDVSALKSLSEDDAFAIWGAKLDEKFDRAEFQRSNAPSMIPSILTAGIAATNNLNNNNRPAQTFTLIKVPHINIPRPTQVAAPVIPEQMNRPDDNQDLFDEVFGKLDEGDPFQLGSIDDATGELTDLLRDAGPAQKKRKLLEPDINTTTTSTTTTSTTTSAARNAPLNPTLVLATPAPAPTLHNVVVKTTPSITALTLFNNNANQTSSVPTAPTQSSNYFYFNCTPMKLDEAKQFGFALIKSMNFAFLQKDNNMIIPLLDEEQSVNFDEVAKAKLRRQIFDGISDTLRIPKRELLGFASLRAYQEYSAKLPQDPIVKRF